MAIDIQGQITTVANQVGLDPSIALAVANAESGFNPSAMSNRGAIGLFQLMPSTAKGLGVDPYNIDENILGGVTYLKQLFDKYNGDVSLTLAAYNAGPGNVSKYNGIPPFQETQSYVSKILAALGLSSPVPQGISDTTDGEIARTDSLGSSLDTLMSGTGGENTTPIIMFVLVGLGIWGISKIVNG
jgi:hypothetical protein